MQTLGSGGRSVVITGSGIMSPLAHSAAACAGRVYRGETSLAAIAGLDAPAAMLSDIPLEAIPESTRPRIGRLDRLCRLFLAAAFNAVGDAALPPAEIDPERLGLSFGTGLGCLLTNAEFYERIVEHGAAAASPRLFAYTVSSAAAGEVSIALGIKGPNLTLHSGLAAGALAIAYGADQIRAGKADVMLAGGGDALGIAVLRGLRDLGLLRDRPVPPFRDPVPGLNPGEGAAVLVLEEEGHARRRGARVLARLAGCGAGSEPTLTGHDPAPDGIASSLRQALDEAGCAANDVDVVVTSAHGTRLDATELAALRRTLDGGDPVLLAPKSAWGECFAASGALAVALAAETVSARPQLQEGAGYDLAGQPLARTPRRDASLALVHALCYSGPSVALLVAREE